MDVSRIFEHFPTFLRVLKGFWCAIIRKLALGKYSKYQLDRAEHFEKNVIRKILPIYEKVGFTTVEITLNTKNAPELIKEFSIRHPNLNIGAGTVCNMKDLDTATNAGASFIVSPIFSEELIKECIEREIAVFPGALTPTEIYNAHILGSTAIKVFPATNLGANYIQDILAPLDNIKLIAVGGVSKDNLKKLSLLNQNEFAGISFFEKKRPHKGALL